MAERGRFKKEKILTEWSDFKWNLILEMHISNALKYNKLEIISVQSGCKIHLMQGVKET